jgi:hypothetical protein
LSEKPPQAEPTESNKTGQCGCCRKRKTREEKGREGAKRKKIEGEGATRKRKRGGTGTRASGK